jgi:lipoprotein-anchoring transpeptidase ErfK/SrfK
MPERSFLLVASLLAVLLLGAGALYAFDRVHADRIAEGVRVGGIEVGGMSRDEARTEVARAMRSRMREPIVVREGKRSYRLSPRAAGATFDVHRMVDDAVAASREGSIFQRTWREARGEALNESLPARVTYSRLVLARFVDRVERGLNRKPQDARLEFSGQGFKRVPGKLGVRIDSQALQRQLVSAIVGLRPATIRVAARRTEPRVKLADLDEEYGRLIIVDRSNFKLRFYRRLKLVKTYRIAVGAVGFDTPAGLYHIQNKAVNPAWSVPNKPWAGELAGQVIPGGAANNPLKARWMGIYDGAGIHGTAESGSIGSAASHGCIRMHIPDVVELYDRVEVNTPVYIA